MDLKEHQGFLPEEDPKTKEQEATEDEKAVTEK